jgi:hypothetical protein
MRHLPWLLAVALLATGCPTRDEEPAGTGGNAGSGSAGVAGGGGAGNAAGAGVGGKPSQPNTVTITSPTSTVYTNGTISIAITTSEPTTNTVTLSAVGPSGPLTLGTITAPQTSFVWNTSGAGEGMYSISAQLATNGTTVTSNAVSVVVDRTPPQVVISSLIPAIGSNNVVLVAPIQASFSEPILASTVSPTSIPIQTSSGSNVPTTVTLSADAKTATVRVTSPHGNVILGQQFNGSFTNAITDLAGNPLLPLSTSWGWNVPEWVQYAPITSSMNATLGFAIGTNYQPVVAYSLCQTASGGGCSPLLHVAVSDGEAWNDLGLVAAGISARESALFLDDKNHPTVAMGEGAPNGNGGAQVAFSTWNGSAWVNTDYPSISLTAAQGVEVDSIAVALDNMGRPFVAYRGDVYSPSISTNIFVVGWTGTAWDSSYGSVDDAQTSTFDLVLNGSGQPVVTIVDSTGNSGAYVWSGTSWSFSGGAAASNASATADTSGNPVMLTSASASWVPVHLSGGTWLPLVSTAVAQSTSSNFPNLTSDINHEPVVAWYSPTTTTPGIGLARWTGTSWDNRPGFATAGATPTPGLPALTVDARNDMWIGWTEGSNVNVWMSNY